MTRCVAGDERGEPTEFDENNESTKTPAVMPQ
jgi:hypothetical protein